MFPKQKETRYDYDLMKNYNLYPFLSEFRKGEALMLPYDFCPFFEGLAERLKDNPQIAFFLWELFYDPKVPLFYRATLYEVNKYFHTKKVILHRDVADPSVLRRSFTVQQFAERCEAADLIMTRVNENHGVCDLIYNLTDSSVAEGICKAVEVNGEIIGFNIECGSLRYKIIVEPCADSELMARLWKQMKGWGIK